MGLPSRAFVAKSLSEWTAKFAIRDAKWRWYRYRSRRPAAERLELRAKWWKLRQEALDKIDLRKGQLARMPVSSMSDAGIQFLAREEGQRNYAYNDPAGHATFGIGHLIHRGGVTASDRRAWGTPGNPKSNEFVLKVFRSDLEKYEAAVRRAIKKPMTQKQFDAMVSLCYNIGTGGFANSSVARRFNAGDRRGAADAFLMWDNPSMLRPRRERERRLFLGGSYG